MFNTSKWILALIVVCFASTSAFSHAAEGKAEDSEEQEMAFDLEYLIAHASSRKIEFGRVVPFGSAHFAFKQGRGAGVLRDHIRSTVGQGQFTPPRQAEQLWNTYSKNQEFYRVDDADALRDAGFPPQVVSVIYSETPPFEEPTSDKRAFVATENHIFQIVAKPSGEVTVRCPYCKDTHGALCDLVTTLAEAKRRCSGCEAKSASAADEHQSAFTFSRKNARGRRVIRKTTG